VSRPPLRLGTRKSRWPWPVRQVARLITERTGVSVELVGVTNFGDVTRADLAQIGGTGVFASALRETSGRPGRPGGALAQGPPGGPRPPVVLAAVPARKTRGTRWPPGTAPSSPTWPGATVGTGFPAPAALLRLLAPTSAGAGPRKRAPGWARSNRVNWTRAAGQRRAGPDRPAGRRDPDLRARKRCCPRPDRARWAVECRAGDPTWPRCWPRWTTGFSRAAVTAERAVRPDWPPAAARR